MASVQCFKNAEKSYYQKSHHGHRMEHAMSHSQIQCYGQSEKHLPLGYGYMAHSNGHMAYSSGNGYIANGHGYMAHGHGYMAQTHGHHSEHAMAKTMTPWMGLNNGHHLGQHAQTHFITQAHCYKKENSSCNGSPRRRANTRRKRRSYSRRNPRYANLVVSAAAAIARARATTASERRRYKRLKGSSC